MTRPRRIGLLGGTSWESTLEYYRLIKQRSNALLGGHDTAEVLLYSFNFGELMRARAGGRSDEIGARIADCARGLVALGAELLAICSNTGHQRAEAIERSAGVPLVHIADATAAAIGRAGARCVGLVGTRETMELGFYRERLVDRWGLQVLVPAETDRRRVHEIAVEEISRGIRSDSSRGELVSILERLGGAGAECVVLGCTELPLLVAQRDIAIPLYDTLALHAEEIVQRALAPVQ